jgi:hypothetical protein
VEIVPLARIEIDVDHGELLSARVGRIAEPAGPAKVIDLGLDLLRDNEFSRHRIPPYVCPLILLKNIYSVVGTYSSSTLTSWLSLLFSGDTGGGLVANGEALPLVLGILEFVYEGDRIVLEGNTAVTLCVGDKVVFAQTEFSCAFTGLKESGRAEVRPIDAALFQVP